MDERFHLSINVNKSTTSTLSKKSAVHSEKLEEKKKKITNSFTNTFVHFVYLKVLTKKIEIEIKFEIDDKTQQNNQNDQKFWFFHNCQNYRYHSIQDKDQILTHQDWYFKEKLNFKKTVFCLKTTTEMSRNVCMCSNLLFEPVNYFPIPTLWQIDLIIVTFNKICITKKFYHL
jgi:hypothetical protein